MRGTELVRIVEAELSRRGISKAEFYKSTGISSATFSQWRSGQKGEVDRNKKAAPKLPLGTAIDNFLKDNSMVLSPSTG